MTLHPGAGLTETFVSLPDGRRLRAVRGGDPAAGTGPLVVFEAGMSAPAASWVHTQRELSRHARTLAYDRAGYGGSDPDPAPRTLERITDDLVALLDALGENQPVVLVGHSWGGPILRVFAARCPTRVAGLVFVDSTLVEVMPVRAARLSALSFAVMGLCARLGLRQVIERISVPRGFSSDISPADAAIMRRDYACLPAMRTGRQESRQIVASLPTLRRLQEAGTPPVPTVCIQGGRVDRGMTALRPKFNAAAQALMAAVPDGRCIVVPDAGHLVPQEAPAAVHDAILDVLARVGATS